MAKLGPTALPTLGVTATLALLWLLAVAVAGPDGSAAAALDPGRSGSIGEWWGHLQLALALAVAVAMPDLRVLALAPAALLAGEVGEVHIRAAHMLAAAAGSANYLSEFKLVATGTLGAVALGATLRLRHHSCSSAVAAVIMAGGATALSFAAAQAHGFGGAWLAAMEEWSELAVYSLLASVVLSTVSTSHFGTFLGRWAPRISPSTAKSP